MWGEQYTYKTHHIDQQMFRLAVRSLPITDAHHHPSFRLTVVTI